VLVTDAQLLLGVTLTCTGELLLIVVLSPSLPRSFQPQVHKELSFLIAYIAFTETKTLDHVPLTCTGLLTAGKAA
jgi:hypothetical protein